MPRTFVAENVSGLVKGTAKGYFLNILKDLKDSGYRVTCRVLDAQWLGVPQQRQRTIFVGVREGLDAEPVHPSPLPWRYSVREAIPWIFELRRDSFEVKASIVHPSGFKKDEEDSVDDPMPTVMARPEGLGGMGPGQSYLQRKVIKSVRVGKGFRGEEEWVPPDTPYTNVGASPVSGCNQNNNGGKIEIEGDGKIERRKFSIAELRRICAFPDDFILTGTYAQQWERLGRAVPPVMMFHISRTIRDLILFKIDSRRPWTKDPKKLTGDV